MKRGRRKISIIKEIRNNNKKKIWINEDWKTEKQKNMVIDPTKLISDGINIYDKRNLLVYLSTDNIPSLKTDIVIKMFRLSRIYDRLRFRIVSSKAERSLKMALALKKAGINTPTPIALIEKRGFTNKIIYSYFITEYIPHEYTLLDILKDDEHPLRNNVKVFIPFIAKDIRKMHDAGIIHNDLHAGNILINNLEKPSFYYIDLNRGRIKKKLSIKKRMKDLARLKLKEDEQRLFMKHYSPDMYQKLIELMRQARNRRKRILSFKRNLKKKIRNKKNK
ncbi:MAG: serine/threonine protein kinase [Firmicutes bacterium]|nr:serine/threonine protein kinase [Bacillota bacterium]